MPFKISFSQQAHADLQEIFDWYEEQQPNLGDRFIKAVDECTERLSVTPDSASIRYDNIRCRLVKHFPYLLHYSVNTPGGIVIVYRIFHTSRKPLWDK